VVAVAVAVLFFVASQVILGIIAVVVAVLLLAMCGMQLAAKRNRT
jgi:hypothetical protein